jgi:hypothetical protein
MTAQPHDANGRTRNVPGEQAARTGGGSAQESTAYEPDVPKPAHPLEPLLQQVATVRAFALHYVAAQSDAAKAAVRRTLLKAAAGLIAAIVAVTFLIVCTILLARGLAELISIAAGNRAWVGNLALGGGTLLIVAIAVGVYVVRQQRAARDQTIRKYESRHYAQRAKFGADVTQRAAN